MGRIVSIDFGTARMGVALSDERRIIATALKTIPCCRTEIETAQKIKEALSPYKDVDLIVIGLPLLLNGTEGDMAQRVKRFAKVLEEVVDLPLVFWDERLTSAGVDKMLSNFDVSRKKRAALSDALSAISILQNYLDSLQFSKH